jgi:hypothetical protein
LFSGSLVRAPGEFCGGLKDDVAKELGLYPGTPVATSIIDAHAGAVGMVGCIASGVSNNINNRLCKYFVNLAVWLNNYIPNLYLLINICLSLTYSFNMWNFHMSYGC